MFSLPGETTLKARLFALYCCPEFYDFLNTSVLIKDKGIIKPHLMPVPNLQYLICVSGLMVYVE